MANTIPTVTLNEPADGEHLKVNGSAGNVLPFNFTVTDPDNATAAIYNCSIMYNSSGSTPNTIIGTNSTMNVSSLAVKTTINSTTALADGRYKWLATCADNGTYSNSSTRTVVIDPDLPDITWTFPKNDNTTRINSTTLNLNVQCSDTNIERVNLTIRQNNASGTIIKTNLTTNITSSPFVQNDSINMGTNISDIYIVELSCADDVSGSPKINDSMSSGKKGTNIMIFNDSTITPNGISQDMTITAWFIEKDDKSTDTPANFVSSADFNKEGTKIKFSFNFTVAKPDTRLVLNMTSSESIRNRSGVTGRRGHIVWGNYFTDFNDTPTNMTLTEKRISDNNYQIVIGGVSNWTGNQIIVIDPVTGGLNVNTETVSFNMSNANAAFQSNTTNDTSPTKDEAIQINITLTDEDVLSSFIFSWDNGTNTLVNDSARNLTGTSQIVSVNKTIERTRGITLTWKWYVNDTTGAWNQSGNYTIIVADFATTFTSNTTNETIP